VADRYKAYEVTLNDDTALTGFITEQNDSVLTLADRDQVHRIARSQIRSIHPQATSLMPDHLLNGLSWEQIRNLVAFLEEGTGGQLAVPPR
jgi:putative heme-binding domain-containing protein